DCYRQRWCQRSRRSGVGNHSKPKGLGRSAMPATSRILDSEIPRASVTGPNTRHRPLHSRIGVPVPSDCAGRLRPCATTTTNWGYLSKVYTHIVQMVANRRRLNPQKLHEPVTDY